jgi:hypothetical protein
MAGKTSASSGNSFREWLPKRELPVARIQKSIGCEIGRGIALIVGVTNNMSAQGTLVAPLKNSPSFSSTLTL